MRPAQDDDSTGQVATHASPFHTTLQPAGDDGAPAATDPTTPALAADPATTVGGAPGDDGTELLGEHDGATAATAATTDAPPSKGAVAVDGPTSSAQPGTRPLATCTRHRVNPSPLPSGCEKVQALPPCRPRPERPPPPKHTRDRRRKHHGPALAARAPP